LIVKIKIISNFIYLFLNDSLLLVEYFIIINNTIIINYISLLKNFNNKLFEIIRKFNDLLNSFENNSNLETIIDNSNKVEKKLN
jgi:hypothetical protein